MKKILLGTTAVVALGAMSTEAFAADKIKLELGGFMYHYVGVINDDEASEAATGNNRAMALSQDSNTEVSISGSTTLDNGLTVTAYMELETDGQETGASTDDSYLTVSSDTLGAVSIGVQAHAADDYKIDAPNAGDFAYTDLDDWAQMADTTGANTAFTFSAYKDWVGDSSNKLKYVTPTFSGVTGFASYSAAEGTNASDADSLDRNAAHDGSTFGVMYAGSVAGADVSADLIRARLNGDMNTTHVGLSAGMSGFTVSGSYVWQTDEDGNTTSANEDGDGKTWDLGVAYNTGPYTVSTSYAIAKNDGRSDIAGENKDTIWRVAGTYDMGAGVALTATYFNAKRDAEDTTTSPTTFNAGKSAQVNGAIAGIEVSF